MNGERRFQNGCLEGVLKDPAAGIIGIFRLNGEKFVAMQERSGRGRQTKSLKKSELFVPGTVSIPFEEFLEIYLPR